MPLQTWACSFRDTRFLFGWSRWFALHQHGQKKRIVWVLHTSRRTNTFENLLFLRTSKHRNKGIDVHYVPSTALPSRFRSKSTFNAETWNIKLDKRNALFGWGTFSCFDRNVEQQANTESENAARSHPTGEVCPAWGLVFKGKWTFHYQLEVVEIVETINNYLWSFWEK